MVDMVVHRRDLPETLARLGRLLTKQPAAKEEAEPARPVAEAV
jgi:acetyl-CoA carboxylase carboxyl transferase subunit beta